MVLHETIGPTTTHFDGFVDAREYEHRTKDIPKGIQPIRLEVGENPIQLPFTERQKKFGDWCRECFPQGKFDLLFKAGGKVGVE